MALKKLGSTKLTDDLVVGGVSLTTDVTGILPVANGGTGISAGTSGGVLCFTASGIIASSLALTENGVVYGGGAGGAPSSTGAGTTGQVLIATSFAPPSWGLLSTDSLNLTFQSYFGRVSFGSPGTESGNAIEIVGTVQNFNGSAIADDTHIIRIVVSDSATSCEPSATATIAAAGSPNGTVLAGSGTATLIIRSATDGTFTIRVSETAAASRYLWVEQGPGSESYIRANTTPAVLTFT